jgi:sarcosine oxidase
VAEEAGEQLVFQTGGLDLEPPESSMPLDDYIASLTACDIPFELLDTTAIARRWPQFRLPDGTRGLYQEAGGLVAAAKATAAHQRLARAHGASLRDHAPVTAIHARGDEIEVRTGGEAYRCRKLVIAADAWTNDLLAHLGLRLPLTVTQEQVTYFAPPSLAEYMPERFPIWIWMDEPSFYGFPVFGEAGIKIGQDVGGKEVTATTRTFAPDAEALARVQSFMDRRLPGARGPILYTKNCQYTMPPDRDFIIDTLPEHPNIALAQGAAHAFKYASLIGKILAELAIDGATASEIGGFAFARPILRMADPPRHFMV